MCGLDPGVADALPDAASARRAARAPFAPGVQLAVHRAGLLRALALELQRGTPDAAAARGRDGLPPQHLGAPAAGGRASFGHPIGYCAVLEGTVATGHLVHLHANRPEAAQLALEAVHAGLASLGRLLEVPLEVGDLEALHASLPLLQVQVLRPIGERNVTVPLLGLEGGDLRPEGARGGLAVGLVPPELLLQVLPLVDEARLHLQELGVHGATVCTARPRAA
mmetsp:Transcript_25099/g.65572  ORF Transcript_25099/g.65572 Transcript_25099/m.65572 type:complete len:223 (+) Transcript_25099:1005-1673(+)